MNLVANLGPEQSTEQPVIACPADLDAVVSDLSDAFAGYPLFRWILHDDAGNAAARNEGAHPSSELCNSMTITFTPAIH